MSAYDPKRTDCVSAGAERIGVTSRAPCMAGRHADAAGKTTVYQWTLAIPVARRCLARRRARCTRPQGRPCEEAAPAHSIAFQAMIPILATKSLPGAG